MKRRLTTSEKVLLTLTFLTIFGVVNGILWKKHSARMKVAKEKVSDLEEELASSEGLASDKKFWEGRGKWITERMPEGQTDQVRAELLETLQDRAQAYGLEMEGQSLVKPAGSSHYREAAVSLYVDGPERAIYQWLGEMQSPENFQLIKHLELYRDSAETDHYRLDCKVVLARWLKP